MAKNPVKVFRNGKEILLTKNANNEFVFNTVKGEVYQISGF